MVMIYCDGPNNIVVNAAITCCCCWLFLAAAVVVVRAGDFPRTVDEYDDDELLSAADGGNGDSGGDQQKWVDLVCPFGWQVFGDHCYLYVKQPVMQWTQAERYCAEVVHGGHLASLHSKEEIELVFGLITEAGSHWFHREHQTYHAFRAANDFIWVGLAYLCPGMETNGGRWSDGSRLKSDVQIQEPSNPDPYYSRHITSSSSLRVSGNARGKQRCVGYHLTGDGGKLVKSYCLDYAPFLCKVRRDISNNNKTGGLETKRKQNLDNESSQCGQYDWCYHNGSCYKISSKEQPWYESRTDCQMEGGDLVSIHSVGEIDYLNNNLTIDWSAGNTFWTGLNKLESIDNRYQWSDNTPVNFAPAVTVEVVAGMAARNPSCVSIKLNQLRRLLAKTVAAGKMTGDEELMLSRCDTTHPAICKKPAGDGSVQSPAAGTTPAPPVGGCPKGWIIFGNRCYRAFGVENSTASVAERANFRDAYQTCVKYKANLVSIQNEFDNLFVFSLLTGGGGDDPVNLNQSWIGLIYHEGRLRWLDETQVTYTNLDQIGLATFGLTASSMTTTPASTGVGSGGTLDSSASYFSRSKAASASDFGDYLGYGSYSSAYLWRQQERCFVMSIDKSPGTWDPVSSSGSLNSIIRVHPSSALGRGKRSVYWPYDWRRSWAFTGESCEQLKLPFVCEKSSSAGESSGEQEWYCDNDQTGDRSNANSSFKHGSNCFEVVTAAPRSWDEAKNYCERASPTSSLTSILSQQEFAFLVSVMKHRKDLSRFWIGMRVFGDANGTSVHAEWVDQWPVWITKWDQQHFWTTNNQRRCVVMTSTDDDSNKLPFWKQESCQKKLPFICKHRKTKVEPPKPAVNGRCEPGWIPGSTQCYKIKKEEWTSGANAMLNCWREHNATLASFPTETDWQFISKSQGLKDVRRRFFIGLIQKVHGNFEWIDNSPLEFVNWAPGEPRFGWNPSVEVCVEMDQNGLWYDAGCHETRHFICSKPKIEDSSMESPFASSPPSAPASTSFPSAPSTPSPSGGAAIASSTSTSAHFPRTSPPLVDGNNDSTNFNQSDHSNLVPRLLSLQKAKSASSQAAVVAGSVISAIIILAVLAFAGTYLYRRHTQGFPLFRRRSMDTMRFEVLNEQNDD